MTPQEIELFNKIVADVRSANDDKNRSLTILTNIVKNHAPDYFRWAAAEKKYSAEFIEMVKNYILSQRMNMDDWGNHTFTHFMSPEDEKKEKDKFPIYPVDRRSNISPGAAPSVKDMNALKAVDGIVTYTPIFSEVQNTILYNRDEASMHVDSYSTNSNHIRYIHEYGYQDRIKHISFFGDRNRVITNRIKEQNTKLLNGCYSLLPYADSVTIGKSKYIRNESHDIEEMLNDVDRLNLLVDFGTNFFWTFLEASNYLGVKNEKFKMNRLNITHNVYLNELNDLLFKSVYSGGELTHITNLAPDLREIRLYGNIYLNYHHALLIESFGLHELFRLDKGSPYSIVSARQDFLLRNATMMRANRSLNAFTEMCYEELQDSLKKPYLNYLHESPIINRIVTRPRPADSLTLSREIDRMVNQINQETSMDGLRNRILEIVKVNSRGSKTILKGVSFYYEDQLIVTI